MTSLVLPHSVDIEREVIGSVLVRPGLVARLIDLGVEPSDFYTETHRFLATAILELARDERPVDEVTVREELKRSGLWERSGGYRALGECLDRSGTCSNIDDYIKRVIEFAAKRSIVDAGMSMTESGLGSAGASEALSQARDRLGRVESHLRAQEGLAASSGVTDYVDYVQKVQSGE